MAEARRVQVVVTVLAVVAVLGHLAWPSLSIDSITLSLLVLGILPWLGPLIESIELPGGWKIGYRKLEQAEKRAAEAGLLAEPTHDISARYAFLPVSTDDPNLALAGLRIELERRLQQIADAYSVRPRRKGLGGLLRELAERQILTPQQSGALTAIVRLLDQAVHGAQVESSAVDWALDVGTRLLAGLEKHLVAAAG